MQSPRVAPFDEHNAELVRNVRPGGWTNPTPAGDYHLIAIGAGAAGIISALAAAGLGGKAALIEEHLLGGDCLNSGCVPSKALLAAARTAHRAKGDAEYGIDSAANQQVDFGQAMQRMRRLRARISRHDAAARFADMGVDVYFGRARFTGRRRLEVDGQELTFRRCVIATGASPAIPPIDGLDQLGCLTNETIFSLTELPRRLIVAGGGPIGCELAQAFARFGSQVTLLEMATRLLPREDAEAAELLARKLREEGIDLRLKTVLRGGQPSQGGEKQLIVESGGRQETLAADEILLALGRAPNVEGLGLEAAGVVYDRRGVQVNDRLRTANRRVYAAGDVVGGPQFTHAADAMARLCVQNAFFFGRKKLSKLVIPRCTYTNPEVAHVGLTAEEANQRGIPIDSYREEFANIDRAILDGSEEGFAVVHTRRGKGQIVGATIVGDRAGDAIAAVSLMMTQKIPLGALGGTIHCYPTRAEILKRIGDQYTRGRLTPRVAGLLKFILTRRR